MKSFKDMARKSLAKKSYWHRMIWSVGMQVIRDFFDNQELEWHIKFSTLHIKTSEQEIKIQAFRKKKEILEKVNEKLSEMGYSRKITDIRF